jgi:hypothetical protein
MSIQQNVWGQPSTNRPTIPPQIYDAYRLAYNNVTYCDLRMALDEAAEIDLQRDSELTEAFIIKVMNLLIDASFERCGAVFYQGAEATLRQALEPLDSRLTGLALRHLANFGASPMVGTPTSVERLAHDLHIARAELSAAEQEARQQAGFKAALAAAWLKAAKWLIGAAADLLTDSYAPGLSWQCGAQDKLVAAMFALKQGIVLMLDEKFTLPIKLRDALLQLLERMSLDDFLR